MDTSKFIKSLLALNGLSIKQLAVLMTEKTNKIYSQGGLTNKIRRESVTLKEAYIIAEILGYKLEFNKD